MSEDTNEPAELPSFTDVEGRAWFLRITVGHTQDILETCGIDLSINKLDKVYAALADPKKLVQVLWILIEKQAHSQSVSPEEFAKGLDGDAIDAAMEAFDQSIVFFTPRRIRPAAKKTIEALAKVQTDAAVQMGQMIEKKIEKSAPALISTAIREMEKRIDEASRSSK